MKAKISALILVLALVFTMAPVALFADDAQVEEYNLYVAGIKVTSENASDVLGDGGSVVFDKGNSTLILTNAQIDAEYVRVYSSESTYSDRYVGIDYEESGLLRINLVGRNTINGYHAGDWGMGVYGAENSNIAILGTGTLDINIDSAIVTNYGVYLGDGSVFDAMDSAKVNITSAGTGIYCSILGVYGEAAVTVESGVDAVVFPRRAGQEVGTVYVGHDADLEVYTSNQDKSALKDIDEEAGNIATVGACGGWKNDEDYYDHWDGYQDPTLSQYAYVKIPYEDSRSRIVSFSPGANGHGGMNSVEKFKGGRFVFPENQFEEDYGYTFVGWKLTSDATVYKPGDVISISEDSTVTAIWLFAAMKIYVGGVQVNPDNINDVLGDGTVSVDIDPANTENDPNPVARLITITLDNATIEADKRTDFGDPATEYGIMFNENVETKCEIILKGKNKIVNNHSYAGVREVVGIRGADAKELKITGDGTLDVDLPVVSQHNTYYGIHNKQPAFIDGAKVNVNVDGEQKQNAIIKGFYTESTNKVSLINKAELNVNTSHGIAFYNNNNDPSDIDLDVEKGSMFQASSRWADDDSWYAIRGGGYVTFSPGSIEQGVLVAENETASDAGIWDGTTDIGIYRHVRIPESVEPETTVPETTKAPEVVKKANPIKVTAKKKKIKAKKLKKKSLKVKSLKVKNAVGKVTFKKVKKGTTKKIYKKVKVTSKGIIKFKKGKYKKKTYKVKVKITAAGNSAYYAKTINKTVKVKIK